MANISNSFVALAFLLIVYFVFNFKEKIFSYENKIYGNILNITLVSTVLEISCFFYLKFISSIDFTYIFINKCILILYVIWTLFFTFYIFILSQKERVSSEILYNKKNILYALCVIFFIIIMMLPLSFIEKDNLKIPTGICSVFTYGLSTVLLLTMVILMLTDIKNAKSKQYYPLYVLFLLGGICLVIQFNYPEVFLLNMLHVIVVTLMYFTIENPDVKMLQQVEIAKQQADRANQAKTDFLSNMSHEIRTPLNAIVGFSQALSEEDCLNDQAQDEVKDIMMASENLLEIVNGILDISKIESGKLEIIAKDYSFKKLWEEIVALGRGRLGDKPLEFRTFYDESIPEVLYGDSTRIKEVIVNLLTNAIKYTKEGFVELKVSSVIKDDVCRLIISVEDSGIGIKQENIEKLFSKFERFGVEKEITIEGTGLGLAITKKLVDLMNGTIVVQSIYGKGSKFTVSIDQKIQVGHHIEDTTQSLNLDELITVDLSNKRVLVVDDNMVNLKVAARLLKDYNLIIDEVDNGMDCINKVMSDTKYDLILMDDMMPKMSGTDTFHHLQELDGFNIPTIALTANAISGMKEKYLGEGFNDYLAKPIDRKELNKIIKKFLVENKNE